MPRGAEIFSTDRRRYTAPDITIAKAWAVLGLIREDDPLAADYLGFMDSVADSNCAFLSNAVAGSLRTAWPCATSTLLETLMLFVI